MSAENFALLKEDIVKNLGALRPLFERYHCHVRHGDMAYITADDRVPVYLITAQLSKLTAQYTFDASLELGADLKSVKLIWRSSVTVESGEHTTTSGSRVYEEVFPYDKGDANQQSEIISVLMPNLIYHLSRAEELKEETPQWRKSPIA